MGSEEPSCPFEGPEKLLELWFAPSRNHVQGGGLLAVTDQGWETVLKEVQCRILSSSKLESSDTGVKAYLLSESSLFVWPHKLILKTCGVTTLLLGLTPLLQLAEHHNLPPVWRCFYSRKSFMFPQFQKGPHKNWTEEVDWLVKYFPNGGSYTVGNLTGDHWLLFLTPSLYKASPIEETASLTSKSPSAIPQPPDQTLEILMTDLHQDTCNLFYVQPEDQSKLNANGNIYGSTIGKEWSKRLGFESLMPHAIPDSFAFSPCGYSANFIQPSSHITSAPQDTSSSSSSSPSSSPSPTVVDPEYATVHITPEPNSSYASFETNIALDRIDAGHFVRSLISQFKPGRLSVTLFVSREDNEDLGLVSPVRSFTEQAKTVLDPLLLNNEGYRRKDTIIYEFEGYDLIYGSFVR